MLRNFVAGCGLGFIGGYNTKKYANVLLPSYMIPKQNSFDELSKIKPRNSDIEAKHAHSAVLKNADNFLSECVEKDNECSFSLVVLRNQNENVDKKWVTFYQASDKPEAVQDMKKVTEDHLKRFVATDKNKKIDVVKY
jgi:hypothetical protein